MNNSLNIAVVGGGAAGFFTAITAKKNFPEANVTIFEKCNKVLAKVKVTGGGRCNLTNTFIHVTDMKQVYPRGSKMMKHLFKLFDNKACMHWFSKHGVPLIIQEDQRVFPKSQDSRTIMEVLLKEANRLGIKVVVNKQIVSLKQNNDGLFCLTFVDRSEIFFNRVAITTGGATISHQLDYLKMLGHTIEKPIPSLFSFKIEEERFLKLKGTVVPQVVVSIQGKKLHAVGDLLITHWGVSGPVILKLSSYAARFLEENHYKAQIAISWVGDRSRKEVEATIHKIIKDNLKKQLNSIRPFNLTSKLWLYIINKVGLDQVRLWSELGKKGFNRIVEVLSNDVYTIIDRGTYKDEFVTCGGISLKSINQNTLESKSCPGLFFAGEILDVDGVTGGFNLQAAWTMGYTVGQYIGIKNNK